MQPCSRPAAAARSTPTPPTRSEPPAAESSPRPPNPVLAPGAGFAIAHRAGVTLADMEFVQFHPTALDTPENPLALVSEAVRGEGAILVNSRGVRFMKGRHKLAERAPRDVVARAIFREQRTGPVYRDARKLGKGFAQ